VLSPPSSPRCTPGPAGLVARVSVGLVLIYLAFFWNDPSWRDPVAGLVVVPAIVTGLLAIRARSSPEPLVATGPVGHLANTAVILAFVLNPATVGTAFLFYGASMLVAAVRRAGDCEVTAISNAVLGRDDQVGCPLFWPVDALEAATRRTRRQRTAA
jgi:hypothetical protein